GQSSNDVVPTALHLAAAVLLGDDLVPALEELAGELRSWAGRHRDVVKLGRTHLCDAVPMTAGQEAGAWAAQVERAAGNLTACLPALCELPLGGTAVGTGLNTHPEFGARTARLLGETLGLPLREAADHFQAQAGGEAVVECSAALRGAALSLLKVANDIRLLQSGPRGGLGELSVPAVQPGSSIMPGKVNPVMAEALAQACIHVVGVDATVAAAHSQNLLQLHCMWPLCAWSLLEGMRILAAAVRAFTVRCIRGLEVHAATCARMVEASTALVTALVPRLGYDAAAALAQRAHREGKTVREICLEEDLFSEEELDRLLDPLRLARPGG
ncbi:MAG TPA: aspartate ammonia-lyase, partial [Acidobacteria bacterium]|nr:aspartate ammonia-lyase [Acidobacteriota bacterium]